MTRRFNPEPGHGDDTITTRREAGAATEAATPEVAAMEAIDGR